MVTGRENFTALIAGPGNEAGYLAGPAGAGGVAGAGCCAAAGAGAAGAAVAGGCGCADGLIQQAWTRPFRVSATFGSMVAPKRTTQRKVAWIWPPGQPNRS